MSFVICVVSFVSELQVARRMFAKDEEILLNSARGSSQIVQAPSPGH